MVLFDYCKLQGIEVLAVEIKQFQGGGQEAWTSRIIGQTEIVRKQKLGNKGKKFPRLNWNSFKLTLPDNNLIKFCEHIIQEAEKRDFLIDWGSKNLIVKSPHSKKGFLYVHSERLEFYWKYMNLTDQQMGDLQIKFAEYDIHKNGSWTYLVPFEREQEDTWAIYQMVLDMLENLEL